MQQLKSINVILDSENILIYPVIVLFDSSNKGISYNNIFDSEVQKSINAYQSLTGYECTCDNQESGYIVYSGDDEYKLTSINMNFMVTKF